MSDTIEIVCPMLENRDEDRFKLLVKSLNKFVKDKNYKLHLISKSGKSPVISKNILSYKESDIDPLFDKKHDLYKNIPEFKNQYGWWKQQLLKLASHKICSSECILFVDCDCFLTKPLEKKNLYKNKKIRINLCFNGSFDNWYNGSRNILRIPEFPIPSEKIGVMPICLSSKILQSLEKYLRLIYKNSFSQFLLLNTNAYRGVATGRKDPVSKSLSTIFDPRDFSSTWTETTLYHIFAEYTGMMSEYHTIDNSYQPHGNCFWNPNETDTWKPEASFKKGHKFYFTVAQSVAHKTPQWVEEKVKEYLS